MRIVSWNIRGNNGVQPARRSAIVHALDRASADIIVLQEVAWKGGLHADLMERLAQHGWPHAAYGGVEGSTEKRYGNLIAAREPLVADEGDWAPGTPWRQSLLKATVLGAEGPVVVVGAHIPNGSGNGWRKVETLEALAAALAPERIHGPTLLAGDFNEPRSFLNDGSALPFSMVKRASGEWSDAGQKRGACGRTFDRHRWTSAVRAVLGRSPTIGLERVSHEPGAETSARMTHEVRGKARSFDHIFVSPHWVVNDAGVQDGVREDGTSDHSLVWADVVLG